jgi:serine/threonine protein kinase
LNTVRDKTILDNKDWRREVDLILFKQYQSNHANQGNQANQTNQGNQTNQANQTNQGNQFVSLTVTSLIRFLHNIFQHLDKYRTFVGEAKNIGEACDHLLQFCPYLLIECFDYVKIKLSHFCCSGGTRTPGWQAPEQLDRKHGDMYSDKYVLGYILHFCIIGEHMFGKFKDDGEIYNLDECNNLVKLGVLCLPKSKLLPEAIYLITELSHLKPTDMYIILYNYLFFV